MKKANKDIFKWWGAWTSLMLLLTVPYWLSGVDSYLIWGGNLSYIFISFSGVSKAVMDTLQFHYNKSVFDKLNYRFWNPEFSWINKYEGKNRIDFVRRKWFKIVPVPVVFTDGWHLVQSIHISLLCASIVTYSATWHVVIDFLVYSFMYRAFFFLFYNYFLVKK